MKSILTVMIACSALAVAVPAQAQVQFGVQLPWAEDFDWGLGARASFDTGRIVPTSRVVASFDLYFPDAGRWENDLNFWEFNANALHGLPFGNAAVSSYVGAGLHFYHFESELDAFLFPDETVTDEGLGLNLIGGVEFPIPAPIKPFVELKVEIGGAEQWMLTSGILF